MILFCEDCGTKNKLNAAGIENEIEYRCSSCGYLNKTGLKKKLSPRYDLLSCLKSCPDIIGLFLYHRQKGVVDNRMPDMLKRDDLELLAKILIKKYLTGLSCFPDITRMALAIKGRNLVIQMINGEVALILTSRQFPLPDTVEKLLEPASFEKTKLVF